MKKIICYISLLLSASAAIALDRVPEFKPKYDLLPPAVKSAPEYAQEDKLLNDNGDWDIPKSTWESRAKSVLPNLSTVSSATLVQMADIINEDAKILTQNMPNGLDVNGHYSGVGGFSGTAFSLFPSDKGSPVGVARYGKGRIIFIGHDGLYSQVIGENSNIKQFFRNIISLTGAHTKIGIASHMGRSDLEKFSFNLDKISVKSLNYQTIDDANLYLIQGVGRLREIGLEKLLPKVKEGATLVLANTFWAGTDELNRSPLKDLVNASGLIYTATLNPKDVKQVILNFWPYTNATYFANSYTQLRANDYIQFAICNTLSNTLSEAAHYDYSMVKTNLERLIYSMPLPAITKKTPLNSKLEPIKALIARLQGDALKHEQLTDIVHPSSTDWPGRVDSSAKRISRTLTVDLLAPNKGHAYADRPTWKMTGLYAPAGQPITITIPKLLVGKGFKAQIGTHVDVNYGWHDQWLRFPDIVKTVDLNSESTTFSSAFGGLVVFLSPSGTAQDYQRITISGAVATPFYSYGQTTPEMWKNHQASQGAWGYIQTPNLLLFSNSDHLRKNKNPHAVALHWYNVMTHFDKINGMENLRQRPEMVSSERQITVGYGHSGYPGVMCYDDDDILVSERIIKDGDWGFYHELGHAFQAALLSRTRLASHAEIDVNLYPYVAYEKLHGSLDPLHYNSPHSTVDRRALAKDWENFSKIPIRDRNFNTSPTRGAIQYLFYWELISAFGWAIIEKPYREMYLDIDNQNSPSTNGLSHQTRLLKLMILQSKHNLLPYFEAFGLNDYLAPLKKDLTILALPKWEWNRPPREMKAQIISVNENTVSATQPIAKFHTTDPEIANKVYYRISAGNESGAFELDATRGELFLKEPLNFEQNSKIVLKIEAFDSAFLPLSTETVCEVNVKNAQEPVKLKTENYFWFDNASIGDILGKINVTFDDGCEGRIEASSNDYITVDTQTYEIKLKALHANPRIKPPAFYEIEVKAIQTRAGKDEPTQSIRIRIFPEMKKGCLVQTHSFILTERNISAELDLQKGLPPEENEYISSFQWTGNGQANVFKNISTLYVAPETGHYTFFVAADDIADLMFKPIFSKEDARKIANINFYCDPLDFYRNKSQKSKPILLKKGEIILLSLQYIQEGGGAHFAVAVQTPSSKKPTVINNGIVLSPKVGFFLESK